jgi:DNA polymerase epsilon subunit 1
MHTLTQGGSSGRYRWLKLSEAKMYDPALFRMVQYMMKKVFIQLVSEFKRLGAVIISTNLNKLVIGTKKTHIDDAHK